MSHELFLEDTNNIIDDLCGNDITESQKDSLLESLFYLNKKYNNIYNREPFIIHQSIPILPLISNNNNSIQSILYSFTFSMKVKLIYHKIYSLSLSLSKEDQQVYSNDRGANKKIHDL